MATAIGNTSQTYWKLRLEAWEYSFDKSSNTSIVKWEMWLDTNGGFIDSRTLYLQFVANGETVISRNATVTAPKNGSTLLTSGVRNIAHNADGTKTVTLSAKIIGQGTWTNAIGTATATIDLMLTAIPRKSTLEVSDFTIGQLVPLMIKKADASYTHNISVTIGSSTYQIATGVADSYAWDSSSKASSLYALCPNSRNGQVTFTVETFSGSTTLGTSTTVCKVIASAPPIITDITLTDTNTATSALVSAMDTFVKGESTISVSVSVETVDASSTLKKLDVSLGSSIQSANLSGTSRTSTFTFPKASGTSVDVTVTDSRDNKNTYKYDITQIQYVKPTVAISLERYGTDLDSVRCKVRGRAYIGSFGTGSSSNSISLGFETREAGASTWVANSVTKTVTQDNYNYTVNLDGTFDAGKEYEIRATITDSVQAVTSEVKILPQSLPIYAAHKEHFDIFGSLHIHDRETPSAKAVVTQSKMSALMQFTVAQLTALASMTQLQLTALARLTAAQLNNLADISAVGIQSLGGLAIRIKTETMTTPANDGADLSVTWSTAMPNATYYVGITLASNPNGFTNVGYVISSKTASGCTIHSYNDNAYSVTQSLLLIAISM